MLTTLVIPHRNLNTLVNFGLTLFIRMPDITWPPDRHEKRFLEHESAKAFALDGIHSVLILITSFSICKCTPCAHRSKGDIGHREESHQLLATLLSISIVVNFPAHMLVKVSKVIRTAKNSATFIFTSRTESCTNDCMVSHSSQDICQNSPPRFIVRVSL